MRSNLERSSTSGWPRPGRRARVAIALLATLALGGCAVGMISVGAPVRLPARTLPALEQPVRFDVCLTPDGSGPWKRDRELFGGLVAKALAHGGVQAELAAPGSPSTFTITVHEAEDQLAWSGMISFFTLSVIPGYMVERRSLEVNLAWHDAAQGERRDHLAYEVRTRSFVWAPLIVHPDFVLSMGGSWVSARYEDAGFEATFRRLADDLRDRLGREGRAPPPDGGGVSCPSRVPATGSGR